MDEVLRGHDAGTVGGDGGNRVCDLGLEGVDVQDGILLSKDSVRVVSTMEGFW